MCSTSTVWHKNLENLSFTNPISDSFNSSQTTGFFFRSFSEGFRIFSPLFRQKLLGFLTTGCFFFSLRNKDALLIHCGLWQLRFIGKLSRNSQVHELPRLFLPAGNNDFFFFKWGCMYNFIFLQLEKPPKNIDSPEDSIDGGASETQIIKIQDMKKCLWMMLSN